MSSWSGPKYDQVIQGCNSCDALSDLVRSLRKDLYDTLAALRHLRQTFPFVGGSREWWVAAVEEADAVLARFDNKSTE